MTEDDDESGLALRMARAQITEKALDQADEEEFLKHATPMLSRVPEEMRDDVLAMMRYLASLRIGRPTREFKKRMGMQSMAWYETEGGGAVPDESPWGLSMMLWHVPGIRQVGLDSIPDVEVGPDDRRTVEVSTVFLSYNHQFLNDDRPVLYETMIYWDRPEDVARAERDGIVDGLPSAEMREAAGRLPLDRSAWADFQARYYTREGAEIGHRRVVEALRSSGASLAVLDELEIEP